MDSSYIGMEMKLKGEGRKLGRWEDDKGRRLGKKLVASTLSSNEIHYVNKISAAPESKDCLLLTL
jgi:hypothetical protein